MVEEDTHFDQYEDCSSQDLIVNKAASEGTIRVISWQQVGTMTHNKYSFKFLMVHTRCGAP